MAANVDIKFLKASERQEILKIIDKIQPVENSPELQCCRCGFILIFHRILGCGHKLCKSCYDRMVLENTSHCPNCQAEINRNAIHQSSEVDSSIHKLNVYCIYSKNGCRVTTAIHELNVHIKQCRFSTEALLPKVYIGDQLRKFDLEMNKKIAELSDSVKTLQQKQDELITENINLKTTIEKMAQKIVTGEQVETENVQLSETITDINQKITKLQFDVKEFQDLSLKEKLEFIENLLGDMELKLGTEITKITDQKAIETEKLLKECVSKAKNKLKDRIHSAKESTDLKHSSLKRKFEQTIDEIKNLNAENSDKFKTEFNEKLETLDLKWISNLNNESQKLSDEIEKIKTELMNENIELKQFDKQAIINNDFELKLGLEKSNLLKQINENSDKLMNSLKSNLVKIMETETNQVKKFAESIATQLHEELESTLLSVRQKLESAEKYIEDMKGDYRKSMDSITIELDQVKKNVIELNYEVQLLSIKSSNEWIEQIMPWPNAHLQLKESDCSLQFLKPFKMLWKVSSFNEVIKGNDKTSEWFPIKMSKLKVKIGLSLSKYGNNLCFSLLFCNDDGTKVTRDSLVDLHEWTFALMDQETETDSVLVTEQPVFNTTGNEWINHGGKTFIDLKLLTQDKNRLVKDDSILIKVELLPLISVFVQPIRHCDGNLEWKITEFSKKREMEINHHRKCYYSESFYSGSRGYRLKGQIYLNGTGFACGGWISVDVCFLRGLFDKEVPLKHKYSATLTIIHPEDSNQNISIESTHLVTKFAEISKIVTGGFLENDTLTLKIAVKTLH